MGTGITNSILMMLVIMLSINVGLALVQYGMEELQIVVTVINIDSSPLSNYYSGSLENGSSLITSDLLPSDDTTQIGDTGDSYTDTYTALRSYVSTGLSSVGFLANALTQPAGFLVDVGVKKPIALSIQIIWSMIFIILITAWIMGRN